MTGAAPTVPVAPVGSAPRAELRLVQQPPPQSALTQARLSAGLTLTELARRMHVSRPTVSIWERGDRAVGRHYWPTLAVVLSLTDDQVVDLFRGRPSSRSDGRRLPGLGPARRTARLTQRRLAERVGVAPTTLAMWENAGAPVPFDMVRTLAAELRSPIAVLTAPPPADMADQRPLRRYRRAAGMTRAEAAAHLGVSPGALSRYESGDRRTPVQVARRMGKLYGQSLMEVLSHSGLVLPALPIGQWRPEDLPAVLQALRLAAGLSKVHLGRAVGRSGQAVAGWEAGRTRPSTALCRRLEIVLGLPAGRPPG